ASAHDVDVPRDDRVGADRRPSGPGANVAAAPMGDQWVCCRPLRGEDYPGGGYRLEGERHVVVTYFSDAAWVDMHQAMWYARVKADIVHTQMFGNDATVTSGRRKAIPGGSSLHPEGKAMDVR